MQLRIESQVFTNISYLGEETHDNTILILHMYYAALIKCYLNQLPYYI